LHLFAVGALLSAISATTQMLAVTWSAAPAPNSTVAGSQRWLLAAGAVTLVVGRQAEATWLLATGAVMVIAAMVALIAILLWIRHGAVTNRFAPAIEAYVAACVAGTVGMSLGIVLGTGHAGTRVAELRGAHLMLNAFGLIGLVIAGTLPYFAATQVRAKMSRLATPVAMRVTSAVLAAATAVAAAGWLVGRHGLVAGGLVAYALGLVAVAAMLPVYARDRLDWAGPRLVQLLCGIAWWAAMSVALAVVTVRQTSDRAVLQALVIGGFAQILVASLGYLGPVLRGGGHRRLTAGFAATRSWVSLVAGNLAAVAALAEDETLTAIGLAVWVIALAVSGVRWRATTKNLRSATDV
jgi:nitrite reductase (NO-forming)